MDFFPMHPQPAPWPAGCVSHTTEAPFDCNAAFKNWHMASLGAWRWHGLRVVGTGVDEKNLGKTAGWVDDTRKRNGAWIYIYIYDIPVFMQYCMNLKYMYV